MRVSKAHAIKGSGWLRFEHEALIHEANLAASACIFFREEKLHRAIKTEFISERSAIKAVNEKKII